MQHAVRKMVIEQSMKVELAEFETVVEKGITCTATVVWVDVIM